jgi:hypothetical protein
MDTPLPAFRATSQRPGRASGLQQRICGQPAASPMLEHGPTRILLRALLSPRIRNLSAQRRPVGGGDQGLGTMEIGFRKAIHRLPPRLPRKPRPALPKCARDIQPTRPLPPPLAPCRARAPGGRPTTASWIRRVLKTTPVVDTPGPSLSGPSSLSCLPQSRLPCPSFPFLLFFFGRLPRSRFGRVRAGSAPCALLCPSGNLFSARLLFRRLLSRR